MNMYMEQFLWVIYPYVVAVIFVLGHIFRYMHDQLNWTAKSSEFLEKDRLKWGVLLFHFGILAVAGGHVAGLIVPKTWFLASGVTDELYHMAALGGGGLAGLMTGAGIVCLTIRRFGHERVAATGSFGDRLVVIVLLAEILLGLAGTASGSFAARHAFDYRETIAPWLRGLLSFQPDITLLQTVPAIFRAHILLGLAIFALWPFTRLVHVWSVPVEYLSRAYIHYRTGRKRSLTVPGYYPGRQENSTAATRALVMATLAMLMSFAVWGLISSQSTRFQALLGLSDAQTGVIIAIPVLMGSITRIPMGILTEMYGGRKIFTALLLFCAIPIWGLLSAATYPELLFWGFWLGLAGSSFAIGIPFVSKWFSPARQGLVLGIYGMGNIGTAVANFTVPALNRSMGPEGTFYIYFAGIVLFALLYYCTVQDAAAKPAAVSLVASMAAVCKTQPVWVLSLFYFLTFGSFVAMGNYLPKLLVDIFQITGVEAGLRTAGFVVVATLFRPAGGYLADRLGGHSVLSWVFATIAVTAGVLSVDTSFWPVTVASLILAAAAGVGNGAVFKLVPLYYPKQTGVVTGIAGAAGGIGGFFPPLVLGGVRQAYGSYFIGFLLLAIFALACWYLNSRNAIKRAPV